MLAKEYDAKNDCQAYMYAFLAQAIFPLAQIYVIENNFTTFEINVMRGILMVLLTMWIARRHDIDLYYSFKHSLRLHVVRSAVFVAWIGMLTVSYYYLPFAVLYSINICGSLSVFVWDSYLYGIRINSKQRQGVVLGALGAILIVNADFLMSLVDSSY
jgi:drug/metabolite transporter (DMT)-like permease